MTFTPATGIVIEYKNEVGVVKFVCDECLTFCKYDPNNNKEIGSVCIVVYSYDWDNIRLLGGHHRS